MGGGDAARHGALVGLGVALTGVPLAVLWRLLAPLARARVEGGVAVVAGHAELAAGQDGVFALLTGGAGVAVAVVLAVVVRRHELAALLGALGGSGLAAVLTWRGGQLLSPAPLAAQVAAGSRAPLTPVALHALGALLLYPLALVAARLAAAVLAGARARPASAGTGRALSSGSHPSG